MKDIIKALKIIRTEEKLKITDEVLFKSAIKIYISNNINKSKEKNKTLLATPKQIDLLYKLNADFNARKISKEQARKLIESIINKDKNKK